jgi:hypothetical protein
MASVKPIEQSADKWQRRASVAGPDYERGVANPRTPWATAAAGADGNYRQGVTAAASAGKYAAGVRRAGDEKWRANSVAKGPTRFAEGVSLAVGEWQRGFAPYQQALTSLTLPARGPAGSPNNLQRVSAVAQAQRAVKDRIGGGK